jgi:hypothetical protein
LYSDNDNTGDFEPAASITPFGKGKIAAIYINMGERYINASTTVSREFLYGMVKELFPKPVVEVSGSHHVDVTVNRINGKLSINLINTAGPHANPKIYVYDEIPPIGPLDVIIHTPAKPSAIYLQPSGEQLDFSYKSGETKLRLNRLEIHDIIVVDEFIGN